MNTKTVLGLSGLSFLLSLFAVYVSSTELVTRQGTAGKPTFVPESNRELSSLGTTDEGTTEDTRELTTASPSPMASQSPGALKATILLPKNSIAASKEALEEEAELAAKQLIELLPHNANALHVLAMLNAQLHKTAEAEELWKKCVELDPSSEPYYINLAAIAMDRGENQLAIDTLRSAIAKGIESIDISHHLGVALNSVGESKEAADVARKTLAINPNAGAHWFILGQAQQQLGQFAEAETSLTRALELGGHSKALYFALFNVCMRQGKKEEAITFKSRYDGFKEVELNVEERYQILSEAEARRVCVSILSEAVALYRAMDDLATAEHLLLRILALEPDNQAACEDLVQVYVNSQHLGNEIIVRQRLVELNSTNLLNYLLLAKAYAEAGVPESAEAHIKLAISLAPKTVTGYAAMADFLLEQNQASKAQWYVMQAIRLKPTSQGFQLLAKTLAAQGKIDESQAALDMAKQAAARAPEKASKQ